MKINKDINFSLLIYNKDQRETLLKFLSQFCYKCEKCENIASLSIKDGIGKLLLKCHCPSESKYISLKKFLKIATINPEKQIFCENHKEIIATKFDQEKRKYLCDECINSLLAKNDDIQKRLRDMIINENEKVNNKKHNIKPEIEKEKECEINIEKKVDKKDEKNIENNNGNKEEKPANKHLKEANEDKFYYLKGFIILIVGIGIGIGIIYYFPKKIKDVPIKPNPVNNKTTNITNSSNVKYSYIDEDENKNADLYPKVIVGIDFGSSYSGLAYSLKNNKIIEADEQYIHPTEIILEKDTNKSYKFGRQAHNLYTQNPKYAYFTKMKTELDPGLKKNKETEYTIKAEYPKNYTISLKIIIKEFLEAMANEAIKKLNRRKASKIYTKDDIKWVVTTPAIWDEIGKQITRDAAIEAGMEDITIALEPEAASLMMYKDQSVDNKNKKKGQIFMLIDAGGYTVDITINEIVDKKGNLKQLSPPYGGALGSMNINNDIADIFEQVYGKQYIDEIKEKKYKIWRKILESIESVKTSFIGDSDADNILIDVNFFEQKFCEKLCQKNTTFGIIEYDNNELIISRKIMESIILNRVNKIIDSIKKLIEFNKDIKIDMMALTGGFSNCDILYRELKKNFYNPQRNIVQLDKPSFSVMIGAVIYGKRPSKIVSRISPYTIGDFVYTYDIDNKICLSYDNNEDGKTCYYFDKYITKGDSVDNNYVVKRSYIPHNKGQTGVNFILYRSIKQNVKDIKNKEEMEKIGEVSMDATNATEIEKPIKERIFEIEIIFGSCLTFEAKNKLSGKKIKTSFNYYNRYDYKKNKTKKKNKNNI